MGKAEFVRSVWNYYSLLEKDFLATLRFVELSEQNFSTFSIEYEKQLLSIGSEIDVISRQLSYGSNMGDYKIKYVEKGLQNTSLLVENNQIVIKPFEKINDEKIWWWYSYNEVKHNRLSNNNFTLANQKTVIYSLAALYLLVRQLFLDSGLNVAFLPKSKLFIVDGEVLYNVLDERNGWVQVFDGDRLSIVRMKTNE